MRSTQSVESFTRRTSCVTDAISTSRRFRSGEIKDQRSASNLVHLFSESKMNPGKPVCIDCFMMETHPKCSGTITRGGVKDQRSIAACNKTLLETALMACGRYFHKVGNYNNVFSLIVINSGMSQMSRMQRSLQRCRLIYTSFPINSFQTVATWWITSAESTIPTATMFEWVSINRSIQSTVSRCWECDTVFTSAPRCILHRIPSWEDRRKRKEKSNWTDESIEITKLDKYSCSREWATHSQRIRETDLATYYIFECRIPFLDANFSRERSWTNKGWYHLWAIAAPPYLILSLHSSNSR